MFSNIIVGIAIIVVTGIIELQNKSEEKERNEICED